MTRGMTPEKLFHQLLGLGMSWEVTECVYDSDAGKVRVRVRETPQLWQSERSRATVSISQGRTPGF
jgi:hypothetical protein